MKLYYWPTTRAVRPRWCLEEMNISYDLVQPTMAMTKQSEYRQLHPHGKVPVLIDDDVTIFESAAICTYLADKYPEKGLVPEAGTSGKGYYYQWIFYATLTLEPPVEQFLFNMLPNLPEKVLPDKKRTEFSVDESLQWFARVAQPVTAVINGKNFLIDNRFTTADIIMGGVLVWALKLGMLKDQHILKSYVEKLMERPAFLRSDEDFYAKIDI